MFYLRQILPLFVLPIGVSLALLMAAALLRRRALLWCGIAVLWVSSTPWVATALMRFTEQGLVRTAADRAPEADAIAVLSTGVSVAPGPDAVSEWSDPDRFFGGVELMRTGKAPVLIFTGGWTPLEPDAPPEGEILKRYAVAMGVDGARVFSTARVSNTEEEAAAVAAFLLGRGVTAARVLLVTSAFHMPRARVLFERRGLRVAPFPVDFQSGAAPTGRRVIDWVPTAAATRVSHLALRELYGRAFYRMLSR